MYKTLQRLNVNIVQVKCVSITKDVLRDVFSWKVTKKSRLNRYHVNGSNIFVIDLVTVH